MQYVWKSATNLWNININFQNSINLFFSVKEDFSQPADVSSIQVTNLSHGYRHNPNLLTDFIFFFQTFRKPISFLFNFFWKSNLSHVLIVISRIHPGFSHRFHLLFQTFRKTIIIQTINSIIIIRLVWSLTLFGKRSQLLYTNADSRLGFNSIWIIVQNAKGGKSFVFSSIPNLCQSLSLLVVHCTMVML